MRYMILVTTSPDGVPEGGPSQEMFKEMGQLIEEMTKAGVLVETAALRPAGEGALVHWNHGDLTVTDDILAEAKVFTSGYAIIQTESREEALDWTKRYLSVHDDAWDVTCELRAIQEP